MAEPPRGESPERRPLASFASLRKRARRWLRDLRSGDREALVRLERWLPRHAQPPGLREVQQALARELGFPSWAALKEQSHVESEGGGDPQARLGIFLEHACIFTPPRDLPAKWRRAERILARHPGIATASLHAAVVCGEVEHVRERLAADPAAVHSRGGPQQWEPLLFACYGRLPHARAREHGLDMARLLLDAGADPNSHFVTRDEWRLRFNALTGVMGQGEMGQPEHPQALALARLLLERGADPNDSQGLYDTHLVGDDTRWLELLFEYGLSSDDPIRWHADPADDFRSGADRCPAMLDYLASGAAVNGHVARLALLLERGADPNARSIYDGRSCYQSALLSGRRDTLALLLRHGARVEPLEGFDAFVAAVRSGDRERAETCLRGHPEYLGIGDPLCEAAHRGETPVVRLLLELGADPNAPSRHGHLPLHNACERREIVELLLRHGADPRGRAFGGSACEWAWHADERELARFLAEQSRSLVDAVFCGHLPLARELLREDARRIHECDPDGEGVLHALTTDPTLAEPLIPLLLEHGADPLSRNAAGRTPAERLEERGGDEVADLLEELRGAAIPPE